MSPKQSPRYFVHQLDEKSYRPIEDAYFAVQVLNDASQAEEIAYRGKQGSEVLAVVHATKGHLSTGDHQIPQAVLDAARRCRVGSGEYVDENGDAVTPSFLTFLNRRPKF